MTKKSKVKSRDPESILTTQMNNLIVLIENSTIINLALKGAPHQVIRKAIGCDIQKITEFLRPIKKYIDNYLKKQKNL